MNRWDTYLLGALCAFIWVWWKSEAEAKRLRLLREAREAASDQSDDQVADPDGS